MALPALSVLLTGCGNLPKVSDIPVAKPSQSAGIGWMEGQFKTCDAADCPSPTRKTLAIAELPAPKKTTTTIAAPNTTKETIVTGPEAPVVSKVLFDFGKHIPSAEGQQELKRLLAIAKKSYLIDLEGRTDDLGSKQFNDRLAKRRADYVRSWLLKQGIKSEIVVRSEGLCCYLDSTTTEMARRLNRRVDVRLVVRQDAFNNSKGAQ